tara:strand:+ start:146 stop:256 length:111 start_codon:yes stop_codon:yes gene_type:complete
VALVAVVLGNLFTKQAAEEVLVVIGHQQKRILPQLA